MIDRSHIGRTWPPFEVLVEQGRLRLFAKAIGETRPVYTDEAAARAAGHRSLLAPPTFAFCVLADDPHGMKYMDELGIPVGRMLHAEQRISYNGDICAGDRLRVTRRIADIYDKRGGALEFIAFEVDVQRSSGDLVARNHVLLVVRNQ